MRRRKPIYGRTSTSASSRPGPWIDPDVAYAYEVGKLWIPLCRGQDADLTAVREAFENPPPYVADGSGYSTYSAMAAWIAAIYRGKYAVALGYLDLNWDTEFNENYYSYNPKTSLYGLTYELDGQPELAEREFNAARTRLEHELAANAGDYRLLHRPCGGLSALG